MWAIMRATARPFGAPAANAGRAGSPRAPTARSAMFCALSRALAQTSTARSISSGASSAHCSACMPPSEPPTAACSRSHAEVAQQRAVHGDEVADGEQREVQAVRLAGRGVRSTTARSCPGSRRAGSRRSRRSGRCRPACRGRRACSHQLGRVARRRSARGRRRPRWRRRRRACRRSRRRRRPARASRPTRARAARRRRRAGPRWVSPGSCRDEMTPGVEPGEVQPAVEARVLDLHAAVRYDLQPGLVGDPHRLVAVQPELDPERAGARRDRLLGDAGQVVGLAAEDVDDVGLAGQVGERRVGLAGRGSRPRAGVTGQTS